MATSLPPSPHSVRIGVTRENCGCREFELEAAGLPGAGAGPRAQSRGAQAQSRGGSSHFVVEGQAAFKRLRRRARPQGCGACETSAANYEVANNGNRAMEERWQQHRAQTTPAQFRTAQAEVIASQGIANAAVITASIRNLSLINWACDGVAECMNQLASPNYSPGVER